MDEDLLPREATMSLEVDILPIAADEPTTAELAGRLDRGMVHDPQLLQMRPAVAALVDSFNRRWGG